MNANNVNLSLDDVLKKRKQPTSVRKQRRSQPTNQRRTQPSKQRVQNPVAINNQPRRRLQNPDNFRSQRRPANRQRVQRKNIQVGTPVKAATPKSRLTIGNRQDQIRSKTKLRIENLPKECTNEDLRVLL